MHQKYMNNEKVTLVKYLLLVLTFVATTCYPIDKLNEDKAVLKDETRYPNGTVVGKYSYLDKEGNPIHVKYFADNASYGVELQSIKVVDTVTDEPNWHPSNFDTLKPAGTPLGITFEFLNLNNTADNKPKKKYYRNNDYKKRGPYKTKTAEYETFYQNDIKAPRECDEDKVRVYLDKEKKIIRRALDNYQAAKYCGKL